MTGTGMVHYSIVVNPCRPMRAGCGALLCGSKLFRSSKELKTVLGQPFLTRWVFDCEMIGRFSALRRGGGTSAGGNNNNNKTSIVESIYEYPLHRWEDVGGSKVKLKDIGMMAWGLVQVRSNYILRPWPPPGDAAQGGSSTKSKKEERRRKKKGGGGAAEEAAEEGIEL